MGKGKLDTTSLLPSFLESKVRGRGRPGVCETESRNEEGGFLADERET